MEQVAQLSRKDRATLHVNWKAMWPLMATAWEMSNRHYPLGRQVTHSNCTVRQSAFETVCNRWNGLEGRRKWRCARGHVSHPISDRLYLHLAPFRTKNLFSIYMNKWLLLSLNNPSCELPQLKLETTYDFLFVCKLTIANRPMCYIFIGIRYIKALYSFNFKLPSRSVNVIIGSKNLYWKYSTVQKRSSRVRL